MMRELLAAIVLIVAPIAINAQTSTSAFGKVDVADLELKECSFEKDAHAMVLFDKADVYFDQEFDIILERHKRIKIFDDKARKAADVRLVYSSYNNYEQLYEISAQTISNVNGKPVITKLDKKQLFREVIDKYTTAVVFTFPNVQPGSILEFKYTWKTASFGNFPAWYFQSELPVRYSELTTSIPDMLIYRTNYRTFSTPIKNKTSAESKSLGQTGYTVNIRSYGLQNVPSLVDEPYMTSWKDNLQKATFQLSRIEPIGGFTQSFNDTWAKVASFLCNDEDFGLQFRKKLEGEDLLITKAKTLKTDAERIAYLFAEVRNAMKWDGNDNWYTNEGISKAWLKKTGNSTEINLILYRLLKQSGVSAYPMIVSTREHGRVNIAFPWLRQFDKAVVTVPVDSVSKYILDASDKYQQFNTYPQDLLNSYGVSIDRENKSYKIVEISQNQPVRKNIFINAEIKPEGKLAGIATLTDFSYHKMKAVKAFKTDGEEKYKERLKDKDNSLKIKAFKMSDVEIDTLPLQESIDFDQDLTAADDNYIYFSPNLFSSFKVNPFLSENRTTSIDFGYNNKYTLTGIFKLPEGYKVDALPKNLTFVMQDKSIVFQRIVIESDGAINVRFVIDFKKSVFTTDQYPEIKQFYKQVFEMLNEQIVLKKS